MRKLQAPTSKLQRNSKVPVHSGDESIVEWAGESGGGLAAGVWRAALREHGGPLARGEFPPFSRGEVSEEKVAGPHAEEAEGGVADSGGHAADLAVLPLDEFEGEPGIGDVFADPDRRIARGERWRGIEEAGAARPGAVVVDGDMTAGEKRERRGGRDTFHLRPVFPAMGVHRIEQASVETGFVAEEEEALGVGIEAAERVDVAGQTEIGEGAPAGAGFGRELREDPVGLVEGEKHAVAVAKALCRVCDYAGAHAHGGQ